MRSESEVEVASKKRRAVTPDAAAREMKTWKVAVLSGDGNGPEGPEVMAEGIKVLRAVERQLRGAESYCRRTVQPRTTHSAENVFCGIAVANCWR
jgi:hypothetical protein